MVSVASRMRRTPEEQSVDRLRDNRYGALVEDLVDEESFVTRITFGCLSCYCTAT